MKYWTFKSNISNTSIWPVFKNEEWKKERFLHKKKVKNYEMLCHCLNYCSGKLNTPTNVWKLTSITWFFIQRNVMVSVAKNCLSFHLLLLLVIHQSVNNVENNMLKHSIQNKYPYKLQMLRDHNWFWILKDLPLWWPPINNVNGHVAISIIRWRSGPGVSNKQPPVQRFGWFWKLILKKSI